MIIDARLKLQLEKLTHMAQYGLRHLQGDLKREIKTARPPEQATSDSLVFVSKQEMVDLALGRGAKCFVKTDALEVQWPSDVTVFTVPSVSLGLALVLPLLDTKKSRFKNSSNASISSTARLGEGVVVGAYAVIGERVIIGSGVHLGAHVVVEDDAIIGSNTIIHPHVHVGARTEIGTHCEIHPHTTIGSDGFGFVTDPKSGQHHKIPHIGRVIIEDHVEIGANCAIDRGTLGETRIRRGCKFDNFVHIAHNCDIGEDSRLTAGFIIAGSSKIGRGFVCGGQAGVSDHVTVADNVSLAARGAIYNDVTESGSYGGAPATKLQSHLRVTKILQDLPEMWKSWRKWQKEETK